jgi:hypothetical protein
VVLWEGVVRINYRAGEACLWAGDVWLVDDAGLVEDAWLVEMCGW